MLMPASARRSVVQTFLLRGLHMFFDRWRPGSLTIRGAIYCGRHSDGRERFRLSTDMVLMQGNLLQITVNETGKRVRNWVRTTPDYPQGSRIIHRIYGFGMKTGKEFVMLGELSCFTPSRFAECDSSNPLMANQKQGASRFLDCDCAQCRIIYADLVGCSTRHGRLGMKVPTPV